MPSKQLHSEVLAGDSETANTMALKDGTTSKNMLSQFPGGRNVPSEILLEILSPLLSLLSYPAIPYPAILLEISNPIQSIQSNFECCGCCCWWLPAACVLLATGCC